MILEIYDFMTWIKTFLFVVVFDKTRNAFVKLYAPNS